MIEPFEIWMDFATRMVDKAIEATPERRTKIREKVIDYIERFKDYPVVGWDDKHSDIGYVCDDFDEWFSEYYIERQGEWEQSRFLRDIACAVRAGLDAALPDRAQGGVLGFTVGPLRKMYPEGLPEYIIDQFTPSLSDAKDEEPIWL